MLNDNKQIVAPVPGVFTFVGADGNDLRDLVMKLNDEWSFYLVKRVGDDATLDALNETLEKVEEDGADRSSMASVEAMQVMPLDERYPVNSYTLKPSRTQQRVAMEEIGKQIVATISNAIQHLLKWLREKFAALAKVFKRVTREAREESGAQALQKTAGLADYRYRDKAELDKDPSFSARAEALTSYFTQYTNVLSNDDKVTALFGRALKDTDEVLDFARHGTELASGMFKDLILGKWSTADEQRVALFRDLDVPSLSAFLAAFNKDNGGLRSQVSAVISKYRDWSETPITIDPYDFPGLLKRVGYLRTRLDPEQSPYLFSDETLTGLEKVVGEMNTLLDGVERTISQVKNGAPDRKGLASLRQMTEKLTEAGMVLHMYGDLADQQYSKSLQFLKILYTHLMAAKAPDAPETPAA